MRICAYKYSTKRPSAAVLGSNKWVLGCTQNQSLTSSVDGPRKVSGESPKSDFSTQEVRSSFPALGLQPREKATCKHHLSTFKASHLFIPLWVLQNASRGCPRHCKRNHDHLEASTFEEPSPCCLAENI